MAADIFTKAITNKEAWQHALRLLNIVDPSLLPDLLATKEDPTAVGAAAVDEVPEKEETSADGGQADVGPQQRSYNDRHQSSEGAQRFYIGDEESCEENNSTVLSNGTNGISRDRENQNN